MARTFNGTSDQIAFGSEAAIDDLTAYTAVAMVRITANVTDERQIFTKMNSSYNGTMYLAASGGGGNNNRIFTLVSGSVAWFAESAADALVVNTWRVVISTWAGGSGTAPKLYACTLGGTIAELSYTGTPAGGNGRVSDAAATLRIGSRDPLDATFYAGGMAEVALWNRVLSADELAALGKGFAPAFFPYGRVAYCPVDGRHSTELNLASGTAGTVSGTSFLDHPPIIYPSSNVWRNKGAAAAPPAGGAPYTKFTGGVPYMNSSFSPRIW